MPSLARLALHLAVLAAPAAAQVPPPLVHVPASKVELKDELWAPRVAAWRARGLPALCERIEAEGYLANFDRVAAKERGGHAGGPEADARVYEAIQAATLAAADAGMRARVEGWIERIAAAARRGDGYVATFVSLEKPRTRFGDLRSDRELFCLGRLIEAGLEWERATGDDALLEVARTAARVADDAVMAPGMFDPPGMPAVELALARLARRTGDEERLWLADDLILRRGDQRDRAPFGKELQDLIPAQKLMRASGDARSFLGLQRGMVEVFASTGEYAMLAAPIHAWRDLVSTQAYPHGGVGREPDGALPDPPRRVARLARAEPATSVELAWLARRLLGLTRQSAFADAEERVLANALSAALSIDGAAILQSAPLEARGGVEREARPDDLRGLAALARFLPDLSGGVYAHDEDDLYVAQYVASEARIDLPAGRVRVTQTTRYPLSGRVEISVRPEKPTRLAVHLRAPEWAGGHVRAGFEGSILDVTLDRGDQLGMWLSFERVWTGAEVLVLELPLAPRRVRSDEEPGRVHLARGPLLYAFEEVDHAAPPASIALPPGAAIEEVERDLGLPAIALRAEGRRAPARPAPAEGEPWGTPEPLTAIPYALIASRGASSFTVWIHEDARAAPGGDAVVERVGARRVRASHLFHVDSLAALFDRVLPPRPDDPTTPRASFRPHSGTREWIEIELGARVSVHGLRAIFAEDAEHAPPSAWSVSRRSGAAWHPCAPIGGGPLPAPAAGANEVALDPFLADAVRIELLLRPDRSAALYELEIDAR